MIGQQLYNTINYHDNRKSSLITSQFSYPSITTYMFVYYP
jgi:hypothetical protein